MYRHIHHPMGAVIPLAVAWPPRIITINKIPPIAVGILVPIKKSKEIMVHLSMIQIRILRDHHRPIVLHPILRPKSNIPTSVVVINRPRLECIHSTVLPLTALLLDNQLLTAEELNILFLLPSRWKIRMLTIIVLMMGLRGNTKGDENFSPKQGISNLRQNVLPRGGRRWERLHFVQKLRKPL